MMEVNHSKIKETNRKKIIKLLLEKDEITKLDISRSLDISITTVSTNITELKEEGIVEDVRPMESTGGRKAMAIKLKENCSYALGIALTPKHVKLLLINVKNKEIEKIKVRHNNDGIDHIVNLVKENISDILKNHNIDEKQLLGIGISVPGTVDSDNGIIKRCYLLNVNNVNLKEQFEYLNVPIYIENEANLSAYYEYLNKKDLVDNLLYVSITDGLGLGIIINGNIYKGSSNCAGEMGHMKIKIGGKLCKCGAKGCFEAYTSKNALIDAYNESGNSINEIEEFEDLYNINDENIKKVLTEYIDILGAGISNLTMLFDPKIIVIGGEINNILINEIDNLKNIIYKDNLFLDESICKVEITKFKESYLLGAARFVIEEFLRIK
ncbi:ROK family protein [Clostridium butyricum]|uniref:ROK family transcriptional regulator n=1 Tax=Clostridium butyricum TaxID=1492 RepID=A0A2S7F9P3_CLOBU|nr:ROK family transcriptional regulator [Clostridium butyricum]KHD14155.1 ROK family transcriptional regulator [Clostridium butyricum]MDU1006869.1 ROK family transcriptional regulator [Clostridium butyricum]PPV13940.1 ROK family transcriptional regulator [Clostridium butyricum]